MKISLKWLAEFFPNMDFEKLLAQSATLRERLPHAGLEIGSWRRLDEGLEKVIVGQVLSFEKHPQADRLNVCKVKVDDSDRTLQIVCGAPNVRENIKVAVAQVGAILPGNFKIQESKIRGVSSSGMLCSKRELGLGEDSEGILHLSSSAPVGSSLVKVLGLNDEMWDVELTPDRSDCLSHLGVAREVARLLKIETLRLPEFEKLNPKDSSDVPLISVEVQAPKACPLYGAQLFEGIGNLATPEWMARLLDGLGHRSHNALVDTTNYVLMELGHPLHAFDADQIAGSKIIVRFAKQGEKLLTLDGLERQLHPEDLVIADLEKPLALAGVMGGQESAVGSHTKRVLLESALFDRETILATAQRHRIHSDASHRFERGVDPSGAVRAAGRASLLFKQLCGARRRGSYIEIRNEKAEQVFSKVTINFDLRAFKDSIGIDVSAEEVMRALQSVFIECSIKSPNVLTVEVPAHRLDLKREIDLIEEVARLIGFDRIPVVYPTQQVRTQNVSTTLYNRFQRVRHRLLECGLSECMPYAFISEAEAKWVPQHKLVELAKPLTKDWMYLRPNLVFGLLKVIERHAALGQMNASFFDSGSVFTLTESLAQDRSVPCLESKHVAWAFMGPRMNTHWSSDKKSTDRKAQADFFDAKGVAERLRGDLAAIDGKWNSLQFMSLTDFESQAGAEAYARLCSWIPLGLLHPGRSALLVWPAKGADQVVGFVGEMHPQFKNEILNLPAALNLGVSFGEIRFVKDFSDDLQKIFEGQVSETNPRGKMSMSRRVPLVERDISMVLSTTVKSADLEKAMRKVGGAELIDLRCVDVYPLGSGRHSLAYRLLLQGQEETLTDAQIQKVVNDIVKVGQEKFNAELRS